VTHSAPPLGLGSRGPGLTHSTPPLDARVNRLSLRDAKFCIGLFVLALALRAAVILAYGVPPTWDGQFYHRGAVSIAEGNGYSEPATIGGAPGRAPWSHYPVGYSAFIGAAYAVFGSGLRVAPLANAVIGALSAVLSFAIAFEALGRRRARVAGVLAGLHPGLVLYCTLVMTEPLAGFLVLLTGYLAWSVGHRRWGVAAAGIVLALSAFVRPQSLLAAPLLLLVFRGPFRRRLLHTAIAGALSLSVIAPWSVRNCLLLDGCALISTNGGWNLAIGALSDTGRFRPLTAEDGCTEIDGPVAQDRCWAARGAAVIRNDPWTWLSRIPDKLRHTYNHESFAVAYLADAEPARWERDHKWRVMNLMTSFHHALMFVAALGTLSRFPRRLWREHWAQLSVLGALVAFAVYALSLPERPLFWIGVCIPVFGLLRLPGSPPSNPLFRYLFALLAVTSVTHMIFFGDDRYHLAISPVLCILAAAAFRRSTLTSSSVPSHVPELRRVPAE
jgi:4-amino-4-deoxy-L-arabinose transferase-like glycosyltransferase